MAYIKRQMFPIIDIYLTFATINGISHEIRNIDSFLRYVVEYEVDKHCVNKIINSIPEFFAFLFIFVAFDYLHETSPDYM